MPFTHVEIEERKTRSIILLFVFLVVLYGASIILLLAVWNFFAATELSRLEMDALPVTRGWWPSLKVTLYVLGISLLVSLFHWLSSTRDLFDRIVTTIRAKPTDPRDGYHQVLSHIVEEVSIATGGRVIQPMVIPTTAVNACAIVGLEGTSAIAVTEGALALLNRAQLECVVGHEAAHIVSGDGTVSSVFCGLFALHEEALRNLSGERGEGALRGRAAVLVLLTVLILRLTMTIKHLCAMCISREKEYRADAVAVRLTRDPLSLAEALRTISKRWHGVNAPGESLSSLFIVDPGTEWLSEEEGFFADLLSTHPPTTQRIALLLGMAHLDPAQFEQAIASRLSQPIRKTLPAPVSHQEASPQWMVWAGQSWTGPFGSSDMAQQQLTPEQWVRRINEPFTRPAYQDPELLELLRQQYARAHGKLLETECPHCRIGLVSLRYEGAPVQGCPACHGYYIEPDMLARIFARQEYTFDETVKRRGNLLLSDAGYALARAAFRTHKSLGAGWSCPRCNSAVVKKFYTEAFPVEVERCVNCALTWLDADELELLQYLYEHSRIEVDPSGPTL